ncbi:hypothetical protein [Baaleninema simplex]|uniref:hypothetical protein n=1 Tax=Baaleninema simplex TaxID=2862350 RepID=UPI0003642F30|nr:hypothetical protein [Baaleninema simplex]
MRQQVARSQRVLENHRIDWYKGEENSIWTPNSNHSTSAARKVADALEKAQREAQGLPADKARARIVETLRQMGEKFADGSISEDD